ncbi:MAG: hypothetical protein J6Y71_06905 [Ruminococcus sp.]|nr:hypothetical protein [Ruminococcus sp.]
MNTFYTAFEVLKRYIETVQELTIVNFTLKHMTNRCVIWVADNDQDITHFICEKHSPTHFVIYGYDNDYAQVVQTSYDYADVNTPPLGTFMQPDDDSEDIPDEP